MTTTTTTPWAFSAFADEAGPTTDDQIAALQQAGMTRIDPRSVDDVNIVDLTPEHAEKVARKYEAAGITVGMYGSPIGKLDLADDQQTDFDRLARLAKLKDIFGSNRVRMFSYYEKSGAMPPEERMMVTLERMRRLVDEAHSLGMVLYHENETGVFGDHPDDVAVLAEMRDGQTFKLIYDFANYQRTGVSGLNAWGMLKEHTDAIHFKDQKKNGDHCPMGQGDTDSLMILKDAVARGWSGPVTLEPHLHMSDAVMATGVHGQGDTSLADMTPAEKFQLAADAAKKLMTDAGATFD